MKNAYTVLIFRTEILVVITIVIFFVGDAVKSLLTKRQESILSNLQQAQKRAMEIEQVYLDAQKNFQQVSDEVMEIGLQAKESIQQQEKQYQNQIITDLQKLKTTNTSTIYYQQQKIQKQISQKIIHFAIKKVHQKFQKGLNSNVQKSVNKLSIQLLAEGLRLRPPRLL